MLVHDVATGHLVTVEGSTSTGDSPVLVSHSIGTAGADIHFRWRTWNMSR